MQPSIEIDDETFEFLKDHAEPFVDTPATVVRRLIGLDEAPSAQVAVNQPQPVSPVADAGPSYSEAPTEKPPTRKRAKKGGRRAARGSLLPETEYEIPILRYLADEGGRAPSREVIEAVGRALEDKLTEVDREELRSGDVRWKNRVAFVRLRLVEKGDLDGHAPRGTWAITPQGQRRMAQKDVN